jgi:hypothetical protein
VARRQANSQDTDDIDREWVASRLDRIWPAHNSGLAELLIVLRKQLNGDLDALLVLLVIAVGARSENWREILRGDRPGQTEQQPTNTQSISDISGIPRESVRRKLIWLTEAGIIVRDSRGHWQIATSAAERLRPSTQAAIKYFELVFNAALAE